jgi:hypothetical protein
LEEAKFQGLPLCGEVRAYPSLAGYMEEGYEIITFSKSRR